MRGRRESAKPADEAGLLNCCLSLAGTRSAGSRLFVPDKGAICTASELWKAKLTGPVLILLSPFPPSPEGRKEEETEDGKVEMKGWR